MRKLITAAVLCSALFVSASTVGAQTIITPFAGLTFNGDSAGNQPTGGASVLFMGPVAGLELEFGFTPDFYDDNDAFTENFGDSNVTTFSANVVVGVGRGPVRPYITGGAGLMRSFVDSASDFFDDVSSNDFGLNGGGGLIVMFSDHVGLRGDVRYFRSISDVDAGDLEIDLGSFDFWRAYGGVSFAF